MSVAIPKLSKWIYLIVGLAVVLGLIAVGVKSCRLGDENAELKGEMKAYKTMAEKNAAASEKIKAEQTKIIGDMTKKIISANAEAFKKNEQIKDVNKKLSALEADYTTLTDCPAQRDNLGKQVAAWRDKFSLSEAIIKDKDGIIFSLTEKYEAQVIITGAVQVQLMDCLKLQPLYDERILVLEKELKKARFVSGLKTLGIGGVAVVLIVLFTSLKK